MRTGLREPNEALNAYKTMEGDWGGKAVKSPYKRLQGVEDET